AGKSAKWLSTLPSGRTLRSSSRAWLVASPGNERLAISKTSFAGLILASFAHAGAFDQIVGATAQNPSRSIFAESRSVERGAFDSNPIRGLSSDRTMPGQVA